MKRKYGVCFNPPVIEPFLSGIRSPSTIGSTRPKARTRSTSTSASISLEKKRSEQYSSPTSRRRIPGAGDGARRMCAERAADWQSDELAARLRRFGGVRTFELHLRRVHPSLRRRRGLLELGQRFVCGRE